jgi:hypothetical protein
MAAGPRDVRCTRESGRQEHDLARLLSANRDEQRKRKKDRLMARKFDRSLNERILDHPLSRATTSESAALVLNMPATGSAS